MEELADRLVSAKKGSQVTGVLLLACGLFLFMSLATYSNLDAPGSSGFGERTLNWGGKIGAHVSFGTFAAVGYPAYVLAVILLMWGWNRIRREPARPLVRRSVGLAALGLLVTLGSGVADFSPYVAFELGGWLGIQVASTLLIPYIGRLGSAILLGASVVAIVLACTDVDPRQFGVMVRHVARYMGTVIARLGALPGRLLSSLPRPRPKPIDREDIESFEAIVEVLEAPVFGETAQEQEEAPEVDQAERTEPDAAIPTIARFRSVSLLSDDHPPRAAAIAPPPEPRTSKKAASGNGRSNPAGRRPPSRYTIPKFAMLDQVPDSVGQIDRELLLENAKMLEDALSNFDVSGKVVEVSPGPVVTRYEVEPAAGVKVNRIVTLSDDLARVMSAQGIRIQAPVPGKAVVGVEIANHHRESVYLREIVEHSVFRNTKAVLPMALGKTISGEPQVADLSKMPHLLVAGATGAGKSVCINCLIASLLFKASPENLRLLMIDPKVVELTMYNEIPHLLVPVITEPKRASEALKWAVAEMESRYQLLAKLSVRNLADYNNKAEKIAAQSMSEEEEEEAPKKLPYIVIIIDEFADLMLTAPADVETSLMSLAQKSRAVGIHIILATQRPSVNVITGVIKANFPSRIAFQVASKTDSRTILDMNGAERLLGKGDMLFLPGGQGEPVRIHGAFVSGEETERLVASIVDCKYEAEEVAVFLDRSDIRSGADEQDELFDDAIRLVVEFNQASTSFLQRRMKIGYSRAARLMDELESAHIVGPAEGAKPREILIETEAMEAAALPGA